MNHQDTYTDLDPFGCAEMTVRLILAAIMIGCAVSISACTYNRNAPLIDFDANGNTVPVYAAP